MQRYNKYLEYANNYAKINRKKMKAVSYQLSVVSIQYSVVSYFCDEKGSWRT